ncbi:MAG: transcriptional regulator, family [Defluviitaleaceae bacterium]|jgi:transcriptional regulator with XRE-family HTH domain|nr:transcriptional regulator, family [Defluviitaleaceae bacterium]HHW66625.1 helix-turn-helix domain-containing protein [Candidatus Epulonipiscium sp.]
MSRLGQQIADLRNKKGMTRKQLAKKAGISEKALEEMETGRKIINSTILHTFSKILGEPIDDGVINDDFFEENKEEKRASVKKIEKRKDTETAPIEPIWNDAFSSVLKTVPIYDYTLSNVTGSRQLPVVDNKVEGFSKDKVFYLTVEDDDMLGFRMMKGDLVLAFSTHEFNNQGFYFIEYDGKRMLRQIKKLSQSQLLLIENRGVVKTRTVSPQEIKILAKLIRIEINIL